MTYRIEEIAECFQNAGNALRVPLSQIEEQQARWPKVQGAGQHTSLSGERRFPLLSRFMDVEAILK